MKFKDNFLYSYFLNAPIPLAIERYLECEILSKKKFIHPILDIGCGEGLFAFVLFDEKIDVGIDPNGKELKRAEYYGMYDELIECYGNKIPKASATFNTIFSNSVLEHIPDTASVFKEAHRLLTSEGRFYITVPTDMFDKYNVIYQGLVWLKLNHLAERFRCFFNRFWKHYHFYDREGWEKIIRESGFKVVECQEYSFKDTCVMYHSLIPLSFFSMVLKKLKNKWIYSKFIRKTYIGPIYRVLDSLIKKLEHGDKGGIIFFSLRKAEDG